MISAETRTAFAFVDERQPDWSQWNFHIWSLAETAWREYRSAEWYVTRLKAEGFSGRDGLGRYADGVLRHLVERQGADA